MSGKKEQLRGLASALAVGSGWTSVQRAWFPRQGTVILYGHRVAADPEGYLEVLRPEWFASQMEYLARHYEILSLDALVSCLANGRVPPRRSVVVTLDDGFRDNFTTAFPVLHRLGIPATVFLATGSVTTGELPWSQRLGILFQRTEVRELRHPVAGPEAMVLDGAKARKRAYGRLKEPMKSLGRQAREAVLREVSLLLRVEPPRDRMLTWEHVHEMQAGGLHFGAHTYSHPWLAHLPLDEARWEIRQSLEDLRERLSVGSVPFCFPAGDWSPELLAEVKRLGFSGTFRPKTGRWVNGRGTDPFEMVRKGFAAGDGRSLEAELDGPVPWLRETFFRSGRASGGDS